MINTKQKKTTFKQRQVEIIMEITGMSIGKARREWTYLRSYCFMETCTETKLRNYLQSLLGE